MDRNVGMKTLTFVSYVTLVVTAFDVALTVSIPFRFPNSYVAWHIVLSSYALMVILCALLFVLPKLRFDATWKTLVGAALIGLLFNLAGWSPWIITIVFLLALLGLYAVFRGYSKLG